MDMSGISGMGMDMGSDGMFKGTNMHIARVYWYLAAAVVALLGLRRVIEKLRTRVVRHTNARTPYTIPSRPQNIFLQIYDTMIAVCREVAYPQMWWFDGPISKYFNPPALGRCLFLLTYWVVILTMLWSNTILSPSSSMYAYKWEIVGFRAAWVSVTQLPLIYLLGGKTNLVSLITGISYERLNWLHRWIARTLFLTVIVHWSFFFREWWVAGFVKLELSMMPMVKYGFGSWAVLGWMVITGFGYCRQLSYELFVLQHIASFTVLLWLVYSHVPAYATYNVWLAIAFLVLDRASRTFMLLLRNIHPRKNSIDGSGQRYVFGYRASLEAIADGYVLITIRDVSFSWTAGQHVFISVPTCGILQGHPFTISNLPNESRRAQFVVKAYSGFTQKLLRHAQLRQGQDVRAFVTPTYGSAPLDIVERSDSLILIATSTGASFVVPILQHAVQKVNSIRRIRFIWVVRDISHLDWFSKDITEAAKAASAEGVDVNFQAFITRGDVEATNSDHASSFVSSTLDSIDAEKMDKTEQDSLITTKQEQSLTGGKDAEKPRVNVRRGISTPPPQVFSGIRTTAGRPESLDDLIRPTVEDSDGETAIIACGSASFMAKLRNYTAGLSDERAVHKGTGAQSIYLFTETFGW
jgi:ferredoxin-NADP reductase